MGNSSRLSVCVATILCTWVGLVQAQPPAAVPGTINCVQGQVTLDGQPVSGDGSAELAAGATLETGRGMAEVLLTPGVYLRVAEGSTLKWDEASREDVRVELLRGEALVEVDQLDAGRSLDVVDPGADSRLESAGLYDFNASRPAVSVYAGKARVVDDRRAFRLGRGEELPLDRNAAPKARKFDLGRTDALNAWSLKRADFASQVSEWTAYSLLGLSDADSFAAGWHWNPWYHSWAFVPSKGYTVTPFGYGLYAPRTPHYTAPVFGDFR